MVLGAGAWGTLGVFVKALLEAGLTPLDVATVRVAIAWFGCALGVALSQRKKILAKPRELGLFALHGLVAVALYNLLYFAAIEQVGISLAVALLYTAPAWSAVLGRMFLGERHAIRVYLAVLLSMAGVLGAIGGLGGVAPGLPALGVLLGAGAGLSYALFSVFGKPVLGRHPPLTLLFYSFGIGGAVLLMLFSSEGGWARLFGVEPIHWFVLLVVGIFPTFLAYLAYAEGLRRTSASLATLLATVEPVMAVALAAGFAGERLASTQLAGIALVVIAGAVAAAGQTTGVFRFADTRSGSAAAGIEHRTKPDGGRHERSSGIWWTDSEKEVMPMNIYDCFKQVEMRVGQIVNVEDFPEARKPAYRLAIDFGESGTKQSSAQITERYDKRGLLGRRVIAVVNLPPRLIAGFRSEALVLGVPDTQGRVILLRPDEDVPLGSRVF